jgi:hypothetical protein
MKADRASGDAEPLGRFWGARIVRSSACFVAPAMTAVPAIITLSGNYAPVARPGHLFYAVEAAAFSALAQRLQCLS